MSLPDELERLRALHDSGTLTDAEFADAKTKVLAENQPSATVANSGIQQALRRLQIQNEILSLDQDWSVEREDYLLHGKYGSRVVPDAGRGATSAVYACVFFIVLILIAVAFPGFRFAIPIAVLGIIACVWSGMHEVTKANTYNAAYAKYQQRHGELEDRLAVSE